VTEGLTPGERLRSWPWQIGAVMVAAIASDWSFNETTPAYFFERDRPRRGGGGALDSLGVLARRGSAGGRCSLGRRQAKISADGS